MNDKLNGQKDYIFAPEHNNILETAVSYLKKLTSHIESFNKHLIYLTVQKTCIFPPKYFCYKLSTFSKYMGNNC